MEAGSNRPMNMSVTGGGATGGAAESQVTYMSPPPPPITTTTGTGSNHHPHVYLQANTFTTQESLQAIFVHRFKFLKNNGWGPLCAMVIFFILLGESSFGLKSIHTSLTDSINFLVKHLQC